MINRITEWLGYVKQDTIPSQSKESEMPPVEEKATHPEEPSLDAAEPRAEECPSMDISKEASTLSNKTSANDIPCPASGDRIVFCANVDAYTASHSEPCKNSGGKNGIRYAILEMPNDLLKFVVMVPQIEETIEICLKNSCPGFDSVSMWHGIDGSLREWFLCIHYPVSSRMPIPESCQSLLYPSDMEGMLFDLKIQAYQEDHLTTLRSYRNSHENLSPNVIMQWVMRIGDMFKYIFEHGHTLLRVSPDILVICDNEIRLLGTYSFDLPWNERCANDHMQPEYAPMPPECFGFIRHRMTERECVYLMGSIVYFLVAGTDIPTCEMLAYEAAVPARTFHPAFPIGWEEIIDRAITPNPDFRYPTVAKFINALTDGLDQMIARRDYRRTLSYDTAIDTHIGVTKCLRCPVNQDAIFLRSTKDHQRFLIVVADGVSTSTYGSGDIASGIVVSTAQRFWDDHIISAETLNAQAEITEILKAANQEICNYIVERYADQSPQPSECMGTTALVAIIEKGELTLASTGDSRAYIIRSNLMECITRDHNLFTIGIINHVPVELCAVHPHAGSLVQCLGYYEEEEELAFDTFSMRLYPGDTLMMTTDGILDYIACDIPESEKKIAEIVRSNRDAKAICEELIIQANLGGGGDNCGVAIVRVLDNE